MKPLDPITTSVAALKAHRILREARVLELRRQGQTLRAIAEDWGVSPERIRKMQMCAEWTERYQERQLTASAADRSASRLPR